MLYCQSLSVRVPYNLRMLKGSLVACEDALQKKRQPFIKPNYPQAKTDQEDAH